MKATPKTLLVIVLALAIILIGLLVVALSMPQNNHNQGQANTTNESTSKLTQAKLFEGSWETTCFGENYDKPAFNISFSPDGSMCTLTGFEYFAPIGEDEEVIIFDSYEIITVNTTPCLLLSKERGLCFISINSNMIGLTYTDPEDDISLPIAGYEYDGNLDMFENVMMRKGSETRVLPQNINLQALLEQAEYSEEDMSGVVYYPKSNIVHIEFDEVAFFYVHKSGKSEYMETITLPWATKIPAGSIHTDHGFVITDMY